MIVGQWYAVYRKEDVSGVSGTGIIAWVLDLGYGLFMFWDTEINGEPTETWEWIRNVRKFYDIHGHNGATRLVTITDANAARGRELMHHTLPEVMFTIASLTEVMNRV